ncbi:MAG: T9SS type A sorting domain-containing protein [Bacteroidia bacterium]
MKRKLLSTIFVLFLFTSVLTAQKEHNIWYFGHQAGLDFNSGTPVALTDGMMSQLEGCASISSPNGTLLFYTNGVNVWDNSHNIMPNGDSLGGGSSSTQSALIVPFPGNNLLYYIFTSADGQNNFKIFDYSIVDMSLNNGKGDIITKNNVLFSPVNEKLTAVKHSNGVDVWVMSHEFNTNSFIMYLITSAGISPAPLISSIGTYVYFIGYMKFSPDGSKIALAGNSVGGGPTQLFDFNPSTGMIANDKVLTLPPNSACYGLEFSPSGNYLYGSISHFDTLLNGSTFSIYQWDITSNNDSLINASRQEIYGPSYSLYLGALQLGPDGKIYAALDLQVFLGVINNPDLPGVLCNFDTNAVSLNGKLSLLGLPNFITSYFLPTTIKENTEHQNQISVFPNPASTLLTIQSPSKTANTTVILHNTLGEQLLTKQFKEKTTIDIRNFPPGIYFVTISNDEYRVTKKVVKQ